MTRETKHARVGRWKKLSQHVKKHYYTEGGDTGDLNEYVLFSENRQGDRNHRIRIRRDEPSCMVVGSKKISISDESASKLESPLVLSLKNNSPLWVD